ncbi:MULTISPECIES: NAD(P)-binding domain-containing protein [Calothrix]|uniref:NAD(P)-binding domain-containing protein n=2 Tax=Calothrix TaxID=1186 RepID=A0ABR8A6F2_9CYAN|nr:MULTISPECIES: NAD(P)-binding domain-containing protein [Calothrix]MBD2195572.1 NAD(P)-binding domain-containing protein [Calothrix parietina FACHB-288]MBD2224103.1 NAD(P)-binding domain-containing protein [Calothrix anomala FACHB-343]
MNVITEFEYLIIGAGPAGLQLGYFLEKCQRKYLILESGDSPGTSFEKFPRHGKLISINKIHTGYDDKEINLRWDWNSLLNDSDIMLFKNYSRKYFPNASDLVRYLHDFANHFHLNVKYGCQVVNINKDSKFVVTDKDSNIYSASRLIIATGFAKPYIPQIPGIELAENYVDVSTDPEDFVNQKVLIIGKGNSGFETADNLIDTAAIIHIASQNPISMAWKTKYVGHLRAVNNNFLDTYQLKSQNAVLDASITKIERHEGKFIVSFAYTHANGEEEDLVYDRVIVCTGFRFDDSIFDKSCKPELVINNRFPAQTSEWESVNIKDLYFIGVLSHMRDFKKKQSGFIHGFRYNIRAIQKILDYKYHNQELPYQLLTATPEALTEEILKRVNTSSGLWQQTGFLCDLIVISELGKSAKYYQELPKDYIHESKLGKCNHYYTISLEFGLEVGEISDPFALDRVHKNNASNAAQSAFIHPIIRRFCGSRLIQEHHVIEDLAAEWLEDVHIIPLLEFFKVQLSENLESSLVNEDKGYLTSEMLSLALVE